MLNSASRALAWQIAGASGVSCRGMTSARQSSLHPAVAAPSSHPKSTRGCSCCLQGEARRPGPRRQQQVVRPVEAGQGPGCAKGHHRAQPEEGIRCKAGRLPGVHVGVAGVAAVLMPTIFAAQLELHRNSSVRLVRHRRRRSATHRGYRTAASSCPGMRVLGWSETAPCCRHSTQPWP